MVDRTQELDDQHKAWLEIARDTINSRRERSDAILEIAKLSLIRQVPHSNVLGMINEAQQLLSEDDGVHEGDIMNSIGEIKRCYVECVVTKPCPNCGKEVALDLGDNYLSYPGPEDVLMFYCWEGCDHEWEIPVKLTATLTIEEV